MIIVFCPMSGSAYLPVDKWPPFAEEMDHVPRRCERVMFYKAENRYPVANTYYGSGQHAPWVVKSDAVLIPDLDVAVVDVEIEGRSVHSACWNQVRRAAIALDLPEPAIDLEAAEKREKP